MASNAFHLGNQTPRVSHLKPADSNSSMTETTFPHDNPATRKKRSQPVSSQRPLPVMETAIPHAPSSQFSLFPKNPNPLADSAPHVLEEAVALGEPVEGVVALAHRPDESAEGEDLVVALDGAAVVVHLGDRDLHRGVVLGLDDTVRGAALPGDVAVVGGPMLANDPRIVLGEKKGFGSGRRVQVNNFALLVLHFDGSLGLALGGFVAVGIEALAGRRDSGSLVGKYFVVYFGAGRKGSPKSWAPAGRSHD